MIVRTVCILLLFGLLGDTGPEKGREGNALFEKERYAAAAAAYREGIDALADTTGAVYVGLQNNLGLARHRQGRLDAARTAFGRARRAAATKAGRIRVLFNAAAVAAEMGDRKVALRNYRQVLLLDPTHEAARFNYEYLKRQQQSRASGSSPNIEPSPFAKRLKKRAETLVARTQYATAAALMKNGLRKDSTVRAYRDFTRRIEEIAKISRSAP
ncbi:MAG: tetratricopeptide repeat protein [Salinibacter sp.]